MGYEILRTASRSNPAAVAGALAGSIKENGYVEIQAIGAGALNQAIKAVTIARGYCAPAGKDLVIAPAFIEVEIDGQQRTAIRLVISDRHS